VVAIRINKTETKEKVNGSAARDEEQDKMKPKKRVNKIVQKMERN
jgi:hypothetical protein